MLKNSPFYAGFAVDDTTKAKDFYENVVGAGRVIDIGGGLLSLQAVNGYAIVVYPKPGHVPAEHTILNFPVDDIEAAVDQLADRGVAFEHYKGTPVATDDKGIFRGGGPLIAWFTDPAGNVLSVIESEGPR